MTDRKNGRLMLIFADIEALAVAAAAINGYVSDPQQAELYQTQILDLIAMISNRNTEGAEA